MTNPRYCDIIIIYVVQGVAMGTFFHGIYILEIYIILIAIPILLLEAFVLIYDRIFRMYLKLYPEQASLFEKKQMKAKRRDDNMYGIHS